MIFSKQKNQTSIKSANSHETKEESILRKEKAEEMLKGMYGKEEKGQKLYYGTETSTGQLILLDRLSMEYPHGIMIGMPGVGRNYAVQMEMAQVYLADPDNRIIAIDTNGTYSDLCRKMDGYEIRVANDSNTHINPCRIVTRPEEDSEAAVRRKFKFFLAICEMKIEKPAQKIMINRCVNNLYHSYMEHPEFCYEPCGWPTLQGFYDNLLQTYPDDLNAIYLQKKGIHSRELIRSYFSAQEDPKPENRFLLYNIRDVKSEARYNPNQKRTEKTENNSIYTAMLACIEDAYNEMIKNDRENKRTWIYITDPIYLQRCIEYIRDYIMKPAYQTRNVMTYLVNRYGEMLPEIMCQSGYIQIFIPEFKEIIDHKLIKAYSIPEKVVQYTEDNYKKDGSQHKIKGLVSIGQKDKAGNPVFKPFVYPRP